MGDYLDTLKSLWNKLESLAYNKDVVKTTPKAKLVKKVLLVTQTKPKTKYEIAKENMQKIQYQRNKNNIAIPYIPEKSIKLTNAGKLTGAEFSTNMLDSLAKYGAKTNLPIELALGLAAQESTFGNARTNGYKALKDRGVIYGSSVISNWSHGRDNPWRDLVVTSEKKAGVKKAGKSDADYSNINESILNKSIEDGWRYTENLMKNFNPDVNVLEHGFNLFKSGKYNPNDPNHFKDVQNSGKLSLQSPEILKWWNESGKYYYDKYKKGGKLIKYKNPSGPIKYKVELTDSDKKVSDYNKAVYSSVNPLWGVPGFGDAVGLAISAKIKGPQEETEYEVENTLGNKVADAAWRKRLGLSYDDKYLPIFNGDTVRLPKLLEREIPTDTIKLKLRIANTKRLMEKYPKYKYSNAVNVALDSDLKTLEALRKTYKTGKPVGISEWSHNSRLLVNNGEINENAISPLNVFRHYNIRYDKPTNRMYYSKSYDFDTAEHNWDKLVPGNKFYIRGFIDLKK